MCWCGDMKHNDSSEKNKYGMLARRHDAINTNKFQSFANTIICIFGRKQFMVQLALDDDVPSRYHRAPPHCYDCKQQNCEDWFIWSCGLCSGWLLVIGAVYSCSQCSDHASLPRCWWWPLTSDDGNKQSDGWDCEQFSASHPVLTQCNPLLPLSLLLSDHLKSWCSVHLLVFGHHEETDKTWHSQMSNGPNKLLISSVPISAASKEVYHNTQSFPVKTCQKWSHNLHYS